MRIPGVALALVVWASVNAVAQEDSREARDLYNDGLVDEAIQQATTEWEQSGSGEAALVLARARLERYRAFERPVDLTAARRLLDGIDASTLTPREVVDWEVGVATSLFFDDRLGAASVIFERLLDESQLVGEERDRLLDWWATAVDRLGGRHTLDERTQIYDRMAARLDDELVRDPASASASYWAVVAARGVGSAERAWHLAMAAWARASLSGDDAARLRTDLDRVVLQGVIPDMAVARTGEGPEHGLTVREMATLAAEWEELKTFWPGEKRVAPLLGSPGP